VEVLVQEHGVLRRRCGPQELDRLVEKGRLERAAGRLPGHGKALGPARGVVPERPELAGRPRPPELRENSCCDLVRLVLLDFPQRRSRKAALDEQGPPLVVARKKPHGAGPVPAREGVRLLLALRLREVDLEHRRGAVLATRGHDEGDVRKLEGRIELERPLLHELRH
jgi:hypothetical protein